LGHRSDVYRRSSHPRGTRGPHHVARRDDFLIAPRRVRAGLAA
jgi:hypothetical protein